jgi:hypothetical protein
MDYRISIWSLQTEKIRSLITESYTSVPEKRLFHTHIVHYPEFYSDKVHNSIVDCVQWHGDLVISKSSESLMSLWATTRQLGGYNSRFSVLEEFRRRKKTPNIWYVHFDINPQQTLMALGKQQHFPTHLKV